MDDLSHNIKTKSLTTALEILTEQVIEVSSLTVKDLREQKKLQENVDHLSDGIQKATRHFCDCLDVKLKSINPSLDTIEVLHQMLEVAEDISTTCLWLTFEDSSLEAFQEKVASLLESVLQILILWDQEVIISLRKLINDLRNSLFHIRKANTTEELVNLYREFAEQLIRFSNSLYQRLSDLVDQKMQSELIIQLKCIQKLARSMAEIIKNVARYPLSKHSKVSKEFITKEMLSLLDEIEDLLALDGPGGKCYEGASFLTAIDEVLDKLERGHFDDEKLEDRLETILQHSMTVSKFSAEEDREQITRYSHRVLNEYRSLQDILKNLEHNPADISLAVDILRDFLELLEQAVNHSLLRMMVENLSNCTEPMRRLIQKCPLNPGEVKETRSTSDLAIDVEAFDTVMERVLQTCFFALASTEDILKMQVIRCALKLLESLEAEMIPAVYSCYQDPDDTAAACHLQFLWRSFLEHCEHVQVSLDSIADPVAFCHVSEKILTEHVYTLRKHLYTQDSNLLERHSRPISTIVARCLALLKKQKWDKSIHGKIFKKEIKYALKEFNGAAMLTLENISDLRNHRSLLKRAELVLKYLIKGIDSLKRLNDSDLLSSYTETFQESRVAPSSAVFNFPESIEDLPFDPTRVDFVTSTLSRSTLLGRKPSRKLQKTINYSQTKDNFREMDRFVNTKNPWRTRTSTLARSFRTMDSDLIQPSRENSNNAPTLDLTDILEELTVLESTLTSFESSTFHLGLKGSRREKTPMSTSADFTSASKAQSPKPSQAISNGLSTPSQLKSLKIVSERLASIRKQSFKET